MKPFRATLRLSTCAGFALAPLFLFGLTVSGQAAECSAEETFAVAIHGGTTRNPTAVQDRSAYQLSLLKTLREDLTGGAKAIDTVEKAIRAMEDSGLFNAGKAAIANAEGFIETDASIMDGADLNAGAVGSMRLVKNPITAARLVMDKTRHVMMVGDRGETAVVSLGAETVKPDYFIKSKPEDKASNHGTVGAVVLDRCGNLAAGTSTGGYGAKIPGRVGDSPVIGAGTYAKNGVAAVSATGHGEFFIRFAAARSIAARVEYGEQSLADAAKAVIDEMKAAGDGRSGLGGVIVVGADGSVTTPHSTNGMFHGYTTNAKEPVARVTNQN